MSPAIHDLLSEPQEDSFTNPLIPTSGLIEEGEAQEWMSNTADLINRLNACRTAAIETMKNNKLLSTPAEAMSLNNIIFINHNMHDNYSINKKMHNMHIGTNIDKNLSALLRNIRSKKTPDSAYTSFDDEETFLLNCYDPIINSYLDNKLSLKYHGSTYELPGSKNRKKRNGSGSIRGRKPDRSGELRYNDICEAKVKKKSKYWSDLVKIATETRDCLDPVLHCGVPFEEMYLVGILIEGTSCTVLVLDLRMKGLYTIAALFKADILRKIESQFISFVLQQ
ncbi:MAG: hypothetical protein EXX96DRAFT_654195 [Benjaminiella poitrasii]|nr:MAG: hypothetical protein EXX96DRAFT_654195 [Benjaminiella poitrasii]